MNIWALSKDVFLKHLLLVVAEQYETDGLEFSPRWENDFHAIGLNRPDLPGLLAHVYTHGQSDGNYAVQLEFPEPTAAGNMLTAVPTEKEEISLKSLVDILAVHLELEPSSKKA
jgi:hypothetical protein